EALSGRLPIQGESITELCAAILESPFEPISNHCPNLPEGLAEVVEKCLEKDVSKRYHNVAELALALMPFAPKRARICAERASQALVSAGLVKADQLRFPSSIPPPTSGAVRTSRPVHTSGVHASGSFGVPSTNTSPGSPSAVPSNAAVATTEREA